MIGVASDKNFLPDVIPISGTRWASLTVTSSRIDRGTLHVIDFYAAIYHTPPHFGLLG